MERKFQLAERSHRRQIGTEIKKKQSLKKQLQMANEKISALEESVKVVKINNFSFEKHDHDRYNPIGKRKAN